MPDISKFESRTGKLTCNAEEFFTFVTDIRNFERFIPQGTINNWHAEKESCSFNVSMLGTIGFKLTEKEMFNRVVFDGDALNKNDFKLIFDISGDGNNCAKVKVLLNAELNPMLKMMATKPIGQFLEMIINEMERFQGWKDIRV